MKKPLALTETRTALEPDDCSTLLCFRLLQDNNSVLNHNVTSSQSSSSLSSGLSQFLTNIKGLHAAALGIEILCIAAAEIGENTGLYLFGFNLIGYR
ncbi:MAG TPA: hypothetical protein VFR94_00020 [Nitrososphaeraceae archaeon]|nr:hypothetical protein [Nitrososphaeraceae archaeon]